MNDILLYIRNFAIVTNVRYILTMQQCEKLSRHLSSQSRSHCFSPVEELRSTECQRLASAAVTDTAETESGWQVSCVTANTTYTVSSQWLEASGVHVVQRTWSVCVATWRTHCSGTNVDWTSGDPQGWRCSKTGKCENSNQSDRDITSWVVDDRRRRRK